MKDIVLKGFLVLLAFSAIALTVWVVGLVVDHFKYVQNVYQTQQQTKTLAKTPMDDLEDGEFLSTNDVYGNPLRFNRQASDVAITQYVSSAGPDGKWHTDDDIMCEKTDFNKSRIAGKWAAQKGKEFFKGLTSPLPSRFKD